MLSPGTFLQIHYHDRTGGVGQVMSHYVRAASVCFPGAVNLIACHSERTGKMYPGCQLIDMPELEYRSFESLREYKKCTSAICGSLRELIKRSPKPVIVAGHNMNLGKNCALTSSFAALAREYRYSETGRNEVRFFSVIHDFPEEGRIDLMKDIARIHSWGIPIDKDLYAGDALQFVTVGKLGYDILRKSGFAARLLLNPVYGHEQLEARLHIDKHEFRIKAARRCSGSGGVFRAERPVFCCPSRIISRKNIFETLVLGCIGMNGNLLLGRMGTSRADKKLFKTLVSLIREYSLPVVTDAQDLAPAGTAGNPALALYALSDIALSTSVSEGFGYALYEPWVCGIPLIGRRPSGFRYPPGMSSSTLYEYLPVPVQWITIDSMIDEYHTAMCALGIEKKARALKKECISRFVKDDAVDFGALSVPSQAAIIKRVLGSQEMMRSWRGMLHRKYPGWPGLDFLINRAEIVQVNRSGIERCLSFDSFSGKFRKVFLRPGDMIEKGDCSGPLTYLGGLNHFRLLQVRQ